MKKIFTKEEAQKLYGFDAVHVWNDLDSSPVHYNVFIWKIYSTRLDVYGLYHKNIGLTWDTYGTKWLLSTPNNSYDKCNNITIENIKCYLETGNMEPIKMVKCLDCGKEIPEENAIDGIFDEREGYICDDCSSYYLYCDGCEKYYTEKTKEVYVLRGGNLCEDCY